MSVLDGIRMLGPRRTTDVRDVLTRRYAGVAAVVTLWTTLGLASLLSGFDLLGERPLSYLASEPGAGPLFAVGLVVAALLLVAFHNDVRSRFRVTSAFSWAMLVGLAGQVVAALVPLAGGGLAHRVHTTSALVLGASLPVLMWRFAASQPPGRWRRRSYALAWGEAAACALGFYLSARSIAAVAEVLPAAVFHLWIAVVTFRVREMPRGAVVPSVNISGWRSTLPA
jgi:hypothetical protein